MKRPAEVHEIIERYRGDLVKDLRHFIKGSPSAEKLYQMIWYMFGWLDENLEPNETYGGKQFRGSLCLLCYEALKGEHMAALPVASAVEMFHHFSLIHDDVEDKDPMRRGRPTIWKLWGVNHGINSGDGVYLLALKSLDRLGDQKKAYIIRKTLVEKCLEVVEGQFLDFTLEEKDFLDDDVNDLSYMEMVTKKTSVLVGAATMSGAIMASDDEKVWDLFYNYGLNLGIAYQLCDDLVSIWGDPEFTGKIAYNDVIQKKKTLPLILFKEKAKEKESKLMREVFKKEEVTIEDAENIVKLLDNQKIYEECWKLITFYKERAIKTTEAMDVPENYKKTLTNIVDALIPDIKKRNLIKNK